MTILTFPAIRGAKTVEWYLSANTQVQESPFDASVQTIALPGSRWRGTVAWMLPYADFRVLQAFLASLNGRSGRFTFSPPQAWRRASAAIPGPVQIDGADQSGSSIALKGLPTSTVCFLPGDWLSWPDPSGRQQLHMVTASVTSDGGGQATAAIAPPIRRAGSDSEAVEITAPKGVFMLTSDDQGKMLHDGENPLRASVSIEIIEAPIV